MENHRVIGIGCYAKPEKLSRIFKKLVQDYTLGPFERSQLSDEPVSEKINGVDLVRALMAGQRPGICSGDNEGCRFTAITKITGFYLTMNEQGLNLSIFARSDSCRPEIISTRLDGLTKLRQKRLH